MLDIKFVREHADVVRQACEKKNIAADVDAVLAADSRLRELKSAFDEKRAEQNKASKAIATFQGEEKKAAIQRMKAVADEVKAAEQAMKEADAALRPLLLTLPNIPDEAVPAGATDEENVELRKEGTVPTFDFEPKDHVQICQDLDLLDVERATRIAGARTYFLKNDGALLEWAILNLAIDLMVKKGFTPMVVPHLVRTEAMEGTAYLPGGEEQAYRTVKDDTWLIGTSEVPLTSYRMGEILSHEELPVKMVGKSPCYRREAGAAGKDTHGLYRIHQFHKVEQVIYCKNDVEESKRWHAAILQNAEDILQALEMPYRVVNVCGGDLGRPQVQKFDIETWMPSRNAYSETHSASRFHEFQARRLDIRYRDEDGKLHFVHTLNNTVIATPRVLIPLLELHQQKDGSVRIPEALRPFMGGREAILPKS